MSKRKAVTHRPESASARNCVGNAIIAPTVITKDDDFQKELRDFLELMKGVALGFAILGAAFVVMRTSLPTALRVIAPWACATLGVSAGVASALIYARHRFDIKGQPVPIVIVRGFGMITLLLTILGAFAVAGEVGRETVAPKGRATLTSTTSCERTSEISAPSGRD